MKRKQAGQQSAKMGRSETASCNFLFCPTNPRHFDVLSAGGKLDQVTRAIKQPITIRDRNEIDRENGGKMARPLPFCEIVIIARSDHVATAKIGLIYPVF